MLSPSSASLFFFVSPLGRLEEIGRARRRVVHIALRRIAKTFSISARERYALLPFSVSFRCLLLLSSLFSDASSHTPPLLYTLSDRGIVVLPNARRIKCLSRMARANGVSHTHTAFMLARGNGTCPRLTPSQPPVDFVYTLFVHTRGHLYSYTAGKTSRVAGSCRRPPIGAPFLLVAALSTLLDICAPAPDATGRISGFSSKSFEPGRKLRLS